MFPWLYVLKPVRQDCLLTSSHYFFFPSQSVIASRPPKGTELGTGCVHANVYTHTYLRWVLGLTMYGYSKRNMSIPCAVLELIVAWPFHLSGTSHSSREKLAHLPSIHCLISSVPGHSVYMFLCQRKRYRPECKVPVHSSFSLSSYSLHPVPELLRSGVVSPHWFANIFLRVLELCLWHII